MPPEDYKTLGICVGQGQGIRLYSETRNGVALNMFNSLDLATLAFLDVIKTLKYSIYTIQPHCRSRKLRIVQA